MAFRFLAADEHPDHSTLAEFRERHLEALAGLFTHALQLCQKAGLVKLGHVAIDGTKIQGNASKHKAMGYERMGATEKKLNEEVQELLKRADATDAAEDEKYGKGQSGDELARRENRLAKIRAAKAELEAEAKQKAEEKQGAAEARIAERREQEARTGKKGTLRYQTRRRRSRRRQRSAILRIRRVGSCRMGVTRAVSSRGTTRRSPWMQERR